MNPERSGQGRVEKKRAVVVGAGFGGLAAAIRLQSMGIETTLIDRLDCAGGRGAVRKEAGFTFDMGPTVLTVPHFIEELFACQPGQPQLTGADFPRAVLSPNSRIREGVSGGVETSKYVQIIPILPFYRIFFDDGSRFDYDGDPVSTREQIRNLAPEDLEGYERFHAKAGAIFERGFLQLGYTRFESISDMLKVVPDLLKLDAVRPLFKLTKECFKSDKMRQVFSFEPLLVGGNPLRVPGIYAMIHFVEKHWGIHFAMGGTGALVRAFVQKFEELGGTVRLGQEVGKIDIEKIEGKPQVRGVTLMSGERIASDIVVSNGDFVYTMKKLVSPQFRPFFPDFRLNRMRQSMSLVVIYFGFRKSDQEVDLQHHNIILGPRYEGLLSDIFDHGVVAEDFSQYLHIPTLTDPSLAPEGHHAAYTLIPVPNKKAKIDWSVQGPKLVDRVLTFLDQRGYIPGLRERIVCKSYVTPEYFERDLLSWQGNAFGLEPRLTQSAYFRPHNRFSGVRGLYLVGASAQPGGGTPSVMMSAKMMARAVAEDLSLSFSPPEEVRFPVERHGATSESKPENALGSEKPQPAADV